MTNLIPKEALAQYPYLPRLRQLVLEVGDYIRTERRQFDQQAIETKGHPNDLVSYVDRTAEDRLREGLASLTPGCGFIGEEGGTQTTDNSHVWVLDPVDGTTNFVFGIPVYSVSVALQVEGRPALGLVYEVNNDELFWAVRHCGAFLNGQPIRVAADRALAEALLATGFPVQQFGEVDAYLKLVAEFLKRTRGVRRLGSAAVDLAYTACGRFDGFFETNLKHWDVAAGALIVQEAGGTVTAYDGSTDYVNAHTIVASNGSIHQEILALIASHVGV